MAVFGWFVLTLVFIDELLAMAVFGVWGWQHEPRWLLVWLLPVAAMVAWGLFASPKATRSGPVIRPVVKVIVFGLASLALLDAGHPGWALALLVFSVVVNGLAQVPAISRLPTDGPRRDSVRTR
ncbi:hypothetical protein NBCG_03462 [Nocardioidaceae bacterium Broad-1]|nr:hypothetical protein NBCG_03462 [Nocardioidaceae bacterium Broad-1]